LKLPASVQNKKADDDDEDEDSQPKEP
jgi:hypothetical protein